MAARVSACIPIPSEAIMLFAGFSVSEGELTLFGIVAAGVLGNLVGSWIAYAVGYYGRARPAREEQADPHQPQAPGMGRRLVRALRRRRPSSSRGCCRSSAPSSRCRPGWRGCRSGASPCYTLARLDPLGAGAGVCRRSGRRQLGRLAPQPRLPRLRGRRGDRRRRRLLVVKRRRGGGPAGRAAARPSRPAPAALERRRDSRPRARSRSASSRARRSCCRSPAPPTSSSSPGSRAGTGTRSTPSCARASRWRCTPAPRRPC